MSTDKLPASITSDPTETDALAPGGTNTTTEDEAGRKRKHENDIFHALTVGTEHPTKKAPTIYRCDVVDCGKVFGKKFNLKAHKRVHTGEEPFKCTFPGCNKTFKWQSSLSYHEGLHLSNSIEPKEILAAAPLPATDNVATVTQPETTPAVSQPEPIVVPSTEPVVVPAQVDNDDHTQQVVNEAATDAANEAVNEAANEASNEVADGAAQNTTEAKETTEVTETTAASKEAGDTNAAENVITQPENVFSAPDKVITKPENVIMNPEGN